MPRIWVKVGKRLYCCTSVSSTCYSARLDLPPDQRPGDDAIVQATNAINGILSGIPAPGDKGDNLAPHDLCLIAVRNNQGEDTLRLEWVYDDEDVGTYENTDASSFG
jgi:hypothetical protein